MLDSFYEEEGLAWLHEHPEMAQSHLFGEVFTLDLTGRQHFEDFRRDALAGYVLHTELVEIIHPAADRYLLPTRSIV